MAAPPPAYTVTGTTNATGGAPAMNPWDLFCADNELKLDVVQDLVSILSEIKVVLLLDDSGSMNARVVDPGSTVNTFAGGPQITRFV